MTQKIKKGFTPSPKVLVLGFTLIEMLVVISLIGILATLVVANLNSARERARDAQRKSDLRNIQTGLRLYYNDNNAYPASSNGSIVGCDSTSCTWGGSWENDGVTIMNVLPADPLSTTQNYVYTRSATDTDAYTLYACLENKSDDKCTTVAAGVCASTCKYEVKP